MLTEKETAALETLKRVSADTLWGSAIYNFLSKDPTPEAFRILIKDLKSQSQDSPKVMKKILGEAYDKIVCL